MIRRKRAVKGSAKWWTNRLDPLWSKAARTRTPYCEKCGTTEGKLEVHHVRGRDRRSLRWDLRNACVLCFRDHRLWAEVHPLDFAEWFASERPEDYAYVLERAKVSVYHSSIDYEEIEAELRTVLESHGSPRTGTNPTDL